MMTRKNSRLIKKWQMPSIAVLSAIFMISGNNMAHAQCANPVGASGDQIYNTDFSVMQYCDGTDWTAMRGDNLGDHTATQNITMGTNYINNTGGSTAGLRFFGTDTPSLQGTSAASMFGIDIRNLSTSNTAGMGMQFSFADGNSAQLGIMGFAKENGVNDNDTYFSLSTRLSDTVSEVLRIDSAGDFGIGTGGPANASAIMELSSANRGFLAPRVSDPTSAIAAPAIGLIAYNTVTDLYQFYDGTSWRDFGYGAAVAIPADSIDWDDITDTMTLDATTTIDMDTNTADLNFDANTFVIDSSANYVGIGTSSPLVNLHIQYDDIGIGAGEFNGSTDLLVEGINTHVEISSDSTGTTGSALNFTEIDAGTGNLVDKWTIVRETTNGTGNGNLNYYFGTNNSFGTNPLRFIMTSTGQFVVGNSADASAKLQANSDSQGFLAPRVSDPTSAIAAPATGLMAYNTATDLYEFYDGTAWRTFGYGGPGGGFIDDLGDASTDYVTDFNMFMGQGAGASIAAGGQNNLAIGQDAGNDITTASDNILIGKGAGSLITTLGNNVVIGTDAGPDAGGQSVIIGKSAGGNSTALQSIIIGDFAGFTLGNSNTAIGREALYSSSSGGESNVAIGHDAGHGPGYSTGDPDNNVFVGRTSGYNINDGDNNVFLGYQAGDATTDGSSNILIGYDIDASAATASNELNIGGTIFGDLSTDRVGIGVTDTTAINASAQLQIDSTSRGFLAPRVSDPTSAIAAPATGLIAYNTVTDLYQFYDGTSWVNFNAGGTGLFTDNTTHITRENFHIINTGQTSTTAGLDGDGTRSFYDPNKGALRGGTINGGDAAWQNANIGTDSFAWGINTEASGGLSHASGANSLASGVLSFAHGGTALATGFNSIAFGGEVLAGDGTAQTNHATAGKGNFSVAFGLGLASAGNNPRVSGNQSFGIFFGDQVNEDITATNVLALEGGSLLLSNDSGTACDAAKQGALRLNATGDGLEMCDGAGTWAAFSATVADINDIGNVDTSGVVSGNILQYNGTDWVDATVPSNPQYSMVSGWPDAIVCTNGATVRVLDLEQSTSGGGASYHSTTTGNSFNYIDYDNSGNYVGQNGFAAFDCVTSTLSIASLYSAGKAFNFIGGATVADDTLDWDKFVDTMTLDATTTIDMDTNTADLNFDANTFVIDSSANAIGMGAATPDASSILELSSANRGFLAPRVSDPTSAIAAPATGLIAYNTVTDLYEFYDGTAWRTFGYGGPGGGFIDDLGDAATDYVTDFNMFMGQNAGSSIAAGGQYNLAIGQNAGDAITTGDENIAIGYDAGTTITTGEGNVSIGHNAGAANATAWDVIAIGRNAGQNMTTSSFGGPIFIGGNAGQTLTGDTTGAMAIGYNALSAATGSNATGTVAIGQAALFGAGTGVGVQDNTALGKLAGGYFSDGSENVFIGESSGVGVPASWGGSNNVFVGRNIGAALSGTSSNNNVFLGHGTGATLALGGNNILIGQGVDVSGATVSNELNIGGTIFGDLSTDRVGIGVTNAAAINASAQLQIDSTSRGFLAPRVSDPTSAIAAPATGLIAYNTVTDLYQFYDGTAWRDFGYGAAPTIPADSIDWDDIVDAMTLDATTTIDMDTNSADLNFDNATLFIDSSNDSVGINTSSPAGDFHIDEPGGNFTTFRLTNSPSGATSTDGFVMALNTADAGLLVHENWPLTFSTNTTERMRIDANGNVGIGTTTPASELQVIGDVQVSNFVKFDGVAGNAPTYDIPSMVLNDLTNVSVASPSTNEVLTFNGTSWVAQAAGGSGLWTDLTGGRIHYGSAGTEQVGIGTNNPGYTLDVNGDINMVGTGTFRVAGEQFVKYFPSTDDSYNSPSIAIGTGSAHTNLGAGAGFSQYSSALYIGTDAGSNVNTTGGQDLQHAIVGNFAGASITTGSRITALGYNAASGVTTAGNIVALGDNAAQNIDGFSIAIGSWAGGNSTGQSEVFIGNAAGANLTGDSNVAIGDSAGEGIGAGSSASDNVFIGYYSGNAITTGDNNIFVGSQSGDVVTTGSNNIIIGDNIDPSGATVSNQLNIGGTIFGDLSTDRVGIGVTNATGIDADALLQLDATDKGFLAPRVSNPTATIGATATGLLAYDTSTSTYQYYDGTGWKSFATTSGGVSDADNDTKVQVEESADEDIIRFDTAGTERMVINASGFVGIANSSPSVELDVTGDIEYTGTITDVSDIRLKTDIHSLSTDEMIKKIAQIETYSFKMKDDEKGRVEMGVMAQDLEKIFPELVKTANDDMGTKSVNYMGLIAPMIEATKALKAQNDTLSVQMASLQSDRAQTQASLESLNKQVTLLNKAYLQNNMKEASFASPYLWMMLLFGFMGGGFFVWILGYRRFRQS
ncbi:MAG: tail fiber domain-containing protein [Alphaproteobacteria bacterium]